MQVDTTRWRSLHTDREMPVVRYGLAGAPLIYVPTSGGDEGEFGRYGMPEICEPWIDAGRLQVFSIDGCGPRTLFNPELSPADRIRSYAAFERYAADELLPWVLERTGRARLGVVGPSYGAFVAANLLLKRHERVEVACGLGGVYEMWHRLDGYHDDDVYFHTPLEYLPRLEDPAILDAIRSTRGISLFAAADDPWRSETETFARLLREKNLPHHVEIWSSPAGHHERWWREQLRVWLGRSID